jgi:uncharacterized protein
MGIRTSNSFINQRNLLPLSLSGGEKQYQIPVSLQSKFAYDSLMNTEPKAITLPFHSLAQIGKNAWWRFVLAVLIVITLWIGGTGAAIMVFPDLTDAMSGKLIGIPAEREAVIAFGLLHVGFGAGALGLFLAVKFLQGRSAKSAITAAKRFRWGLFFAAGAVAIIVALCISPFTDQRGMEAIQARLAQFSVVDWAFLAVVYGTGVFIQGSWEEVLTRGWLLQQVSLLAKNPWVGVAVSTLVFVAMHIGHPGWATYFTAGLMGAAFGWSAVRLNGLEAAMGAHVANNFVAGLLSGAFLAGNPAALDLADLAGVAVYVAAFIGFVELWARREGARAGA